VAFNCCAFTPVHQLFLVPWTTPLVTYKPFWYLNDMLKCSSLRLLYQVPQMCLDSLFTLALYKLFTYLLISLSCEVVFTVIDIMFMVLLEMGIFLDVKTNKQKGHELA